MADSCSAVVKGWYVVLYFSYRMYMLELQMFYFLFLLITGEITLCINTFTYKTNTREYDRM